MTANKVRSDYNALADIAKSFGSQADTTRQTLNNLKSKVATLQGGQWVGNNADKFYAEWSGEVMPALNRLVNALETAQRVTTQVSQRVKQAEDEAAAVLRGDGGSGGKGDGAVRGGASGGDASGAPGGSSGSASGGGSSSGGPATTPAQPGGGGGSGGSGSGGSGGSGSGSGAGGTVTSRMLSKLDPKVAELAEKSPTLKAQLEKLEKAGVTVEKGTAGGGSYYDTQNKKLIIDPGNSPEFQVTSVTHEGAHALYKTPYHAPTDKMTRDEYVRLNTQEQLRGEGNSQFHEAAVRQEILDAGGPDIGVSGNKSAEYKSIYKDFQDGKLTRDQAIEKMGNTVGQDVTGTTKENYTDYYNKFYRDFWDKNIAPGRKKP